MITWLRAESWRTGEPGQRNCKIISLSFFHTIFICNLGYILMVIPHLKHWIFSIKLINSS